MFGKCIHHYTKKYNMELFKVTVMNIILFYILLLKLSRLF